MCFFPLRTASQTLRRSSTSCSSSSRPPCSQSASPLSSPITAGSSARTDPLSVGGVLHTCVCVFLCPVSSHSIETASGGRQLSLSLFLCILSICFQSAYCLHSVVFALMMTDVSLHFSRRQSPSSSAQWFDEPPRAVIRQRSFSLCAHTGILCLCVLRRVDYPEEYVTV